MNYNLKIIGSRIKTQRKELGLSQDVLSDKILHCDRGVLGKYEKGERLPPLDLLLTMCEKSGCELGYLLGEYEEKTRTDTDICKETNLSSKAVESLKAFKSSFENKQIISFLNMLIEELYNNRYICGDICDLIENTDNYFSKIRSAPVKLRYASSAKEVHETEKEIADLSAAVYGGKYVLSEFFGKFLEQFCLSKSGLSSDEVKKLKIAYSDIQQQVYKDGVNNGEH